MTFSAGRSAKDKLPVSVVIPAADVLEIAEQAKAAKAPVTEEPKAKDEKKSDAGK